MSFEEKALQKHFDDLPHQLQFAYDFIPRTHIWEDPVFLSETNASDQISSD